MFKKSVVNYYVLGLIAITGIACSGNEPRRSSSTRDALPTIPVPQKKIIPPPTRSVYTPPPVVEEYKPRSTGPYASLNDSYQSYVPEPFNDSYTTPLEQSPPVIVERLSPPLVEAIPVEITPADEAVVPDGENLSESEVDLDPFADVPDRETVSVSRKVSIAKSASPVSVAPKKSLSAAANALLLSAKSDANGGRYDSAITKVERALRIEPGSALLWHQLGSFNYGKGRYDQAISLSRKSLNMSGDNQALTTQNLDLMSKAATKTGNTKVFKEVLDYKKMNS